MLAEMPTCGSLARAYVLETRFIGTQIRKSGSSTLCYGFPIKVVILGMAQRSPKLYKERATMPKWCVESYPSSLYKFEKTRFWHFVIISGRGQGGPNPCLLLTYVGITNF